VAAECTCTKSERERGSKTRSVGESSWSFFMVMDWFSFKIYGSFSLSNFECLQWKIDESHEIVDESHVRPDLVTVWFSLKGLKPS
jgi:hypothetical protein